MFLNLAIFFLLFGFVSLPTLIIKGLETNLGNTTVINGSTCFAIPSDRYTTNKSVADLAVDFISGQVCLFRASDRVRSKMGNCVAL